MVHCSVMCAPVISLDLSAVAGAAGEDDWKTQWYNYLAKFHV